jgi:hypothetical protein
MQSLRTGTGHRDGLVKEMDPDAVNRDRDGGRGLAADDMVSYIGAKCPYFVSKLIFTFVRALELR